MSGFEVPSKSPNIKALHVPDVELYQKLPNPFTTNQHVALASIYKDMQTKCVDALGYEGVQKLNDERFDLLFLHGFIHECFLSFAHKLQVCTNLE